MSGHTGKLTTAALAARGPRMRLVTARDTDRFIGFVIDQEGRSALRARFTTYATSYTLSYLIRVANGARMVNQ